MPSRAFRPGGLSSTQAEWDHWKVGLRRLSPRPPHPPKRTVRLIRRIAVLQRRARRRGRRVQPRNVVLGNTLGGAIGVGLAALFGDGPLVLALAVALTILLGQQCRCLHPPAGGMAFLAVFSE